MKYFFLYLTDSKYLNSCVSFNTAPPFVMFYYYYVVQDELKVQEENIEHFHRRSSEIQELLQSHEFPLELQVIFARPGSFHNANLFT